MRSSAARARPWFTPGLVGLHLFAVVAVVACTVMGLWQLGVYEGRQADAAADRRATAPVALAEVWGPDDPFVSDLADRRVEITGRYAPADEQVWVTGREQDGRSGAWLLAPVITTPGSALLVVRGWAPEPGALPPVPDGDVDLTGVLQAGEQVGSAFEPATREIGSVRIPALTNELPYDLYSGYAVATDSDAGLAAAVQPVAEVSWTVGLKNLAYAMQWWVFGAFALFMWWRMAADVVRDRSAPRASAPSVA